MLAAALLAIVSYDHLFVGTVVGFLGSAMLVGLARLPHVATPPSAPFLDRLTRGTRLVWASGEIRGLRGLNLVVAAATAMIIINTVVLVQGVLGRGESDVAVLLGAYGAGSMILALAEGHAEILGWPAPGIAAGGPPGTPGDAAGSA